LPITRRKFLQQSFAAGAAGAAAPLRGGVPAIDTHTHFYDPTRPQGVPWPKPGETLLYKPYLPAQFRSLTAPFGVLGTVVVEASPWVEDNQWVLDLAKEHAAIVGFVGNLQLGQPEFAANLRRFARNPLFRGLRLGEAAIAKGLGQPAFEKDLRRLADARLTLDVIGGPALPPNVARMARLAPPLRFVIDHLPFETWDGDPAAALAALAEVASLPNVYAKVSGVVRRGVEEAALYRPGLDLLWELFGADRLVFGSNWPVSERFAPYATVHRVVAEYFAAKGRAASEKFFWRNSRAAYSWRVRGEARRLK
jgi:predicted TIM-barrel fold metal-dependent hydrolase